MKRATLLLSLLLLILFQNRISAQSCPYFLMQGFNYDFGKYGAGYNWANMAQAIIGQIL